MRLTHAVLIMIFGVASMPTPVTPVIAAECATAGFASDEARAEKIRRLTGATAPHAAMCFGATDVSVVSSDGTMLLDARRDDRVLAARAMHLQMHLDHGAAFDVKRRTTDCATWVEAVLDLEREAVATEVNVARDLGVALPYGMGIEELRRGYAAQCEETTIESRPR